MRLFQPNLFDSPSITYNKAVDRLEKFDTVSASEYLSEYQRYAPHENLEPEYALADFLEQWTVRNAMESDPETAMNLWDRWWTQWESRISEKDRWKNLINRVRRAYFHRVSDTFLNHGGTIMENEFIASGRAIKCLMHAGLWSNALKLAEHTVQFSSEPAKLLGYMGDCAYETGMKTAARNAYLQACVVAPMQIEISAIHDADIKELLGDPAYVCDDHDIPYGPWHEKNEWAGALGIITGIFSVISLSTTHPVVNLKKIFSSYKTGVNNHNLPDDGKNHKYEGSAYTPGQAFTAGLILSFNPSQADIHSDSEIIEIRRTLVSMASELFSIALQRFEDA